MKAAILTIGDEILNGQTVDTNSAWLGKQLNDIGISVVVRLSVGDVHDEILKGLESVFKEADVVIVTGGLGPTKDDVTKKALVEYFDDELAFDDNTYKRIDTYFKKSGRTPTAAHRQQCFMPSKAELIVNNRGTAPGMWFEKDGKTLLSVPGVPYEMKGILIDGALSKISNLNAIQHIQHFIIQTAGFGETYIAEKIEDLVEEFPDELSIAYLPGRATVKLRISGTGTDKDFIKEQINFFGHSICNRMERAVFGLGDISLQEVIGEKAKEKGLTIGTAESCTGGYISHLITSVSGSSAYYKGSVISYDNDIKMNILNVPERTLKNHGAVSEETVQAMVTGLIDHIGVDVAIAVSGIAGPSGGSPEKPVGTIWIAVGDNSRTVTKKLQLSRNRILNIEYTAVLALNELRLFID